MRNNEVLSRSDRESIYEYFTELNKQLKEVIGIIDGIAFTFLPPDEDGEDDEEDSDYED